MNDFLTTVIGGGNTVGAGASAVTFQTSRIDILNYDNQGRITSYKQGNNVTTNKTYTADTGRLTAIQGTLQGAATGAVQSMSYSYDSLSNLKTRADANTGVSESFSYDNLNRLSLYTELGGSVSPPINVQTQYDARGNISYKSDVGQYWYDTARPNRIANITLDTPSGAMPLTGTRRLSYVFDDYLLNARTVGGTTLGNGNLLYTVSHDAVSNKHTVRFESYTSFNMPSQITYTNVSSTDTALPAGSTADRTLNFIYGPEHQRIKQITALDANAPTQYQAGTVWYLNGDDGQNLTYEKEIKANGITEYKHYLTVAGMTFGLYTQREGTGITTNTAGASTSTNQQSTRYFHQDHLGSTAVITDETGAVTERLAYDPWGKRRFANGLIDTGDGLVGLTTDRGYTGHEHLDEVGVIHMNGRIYDPYMGRFMSADPFIQSPFDLQSHNRYSYVMNNPLALTDPSGYFSFFNEVANFGSTVARVWRQDVYPNPVTQIVVVATATAVCGAQCGAYVAAAYSAASAYDRTGSIEQAAKAGLISYATAKGFEWAGGQGASDSAIRYTAHGFVGCVSSVAGGGKCESGAAAAVFGKYATNNWISEVNPGHWDTWQFVATTVAGGVGSVIGGGKFENGARTAAYGYLFNHVSRPLRGGGHHKVTNEIARKYDWSGEALEVFDSLHSDGGGRIPVKGHNFGDGHNAYNKDADDFVKRHLDTTKIEPNKMTTNEAKAMIKSMDAEPKLRNFNVRVYVNGIIKSMRMTTPKGANE